jgi:predicted dithiol-disulfide oxidoreductase (DUF899 family)
MRPLHATNGWWRASNCLEKQLTRQRDALSEARRQLPWVKIDKRYVFNAPQGKRTLAELFDGRSQLIVRHFMFGPDWEEGCIRCSFGADHVDGPMQHLIHHDVTYVTVSRAPLEKLMAYEKRMGWKFPWVSSLGSDFNFDFNVSFAPEQRERGKVLYDYEMIETQMDELSGCSVFYKDENGEVFHTIRPTAAATRKSSAPTWCST